MSFVELFTNCLTLLSCYLLQKHQFCLQILVGAKLFLWSYIFLNLLPFKYLIPIFYDRNFLFILNLLLWLWYGASVWNSVSF